MPTKVSPPDQGGLSAGRVPPHSAEAEVCVLGSMMINPECVGELIEIVDADSFYKHGHRRIFQAIADLFLKQVEPDIVSIKDELARTSRLDEVGGYEYLGEIVQSVPNAANAAHYAGIVREKAIQRKLIQTCTEIIRESQEGTEDADRMLDQAQGMILDVAAAGGSREILKLGEILKGTFKQIEDIHNRKARILGLSTGFHDLDDLISGMQEAHLYILAGRPSMGKTSLAMRIVEHVGLVEKKPVLFASLEMTSAQISQLMLCAHQKVDSHKLRTGNVSEEDFRKLMIAAGVLSEAEIFIDDSADISILELRARARRMKAEHNIGLVVVDYLQKMSARVNRNESREREISIISSQLKSLAKELKVPVLALAQLNRAAEGREGKKPLLSDLRESGTIEQDADVVMLMYRDDYYNPESEKKNICEVIIAKNRTGPTDTLELAFLKEYQRFESLSQQSVS